MIDIVVIRDPDASNDISVFGDDDAFVVDIDLGNADLSQSVEFDPWAAAHHDNVLAARFIDAQRIIAETVRNTAEAYDHVEPTWVDNVLNPPRIKLTHDGWVLVK